ncbi:MAG: dual specificity protein phosphatase family protein, partial [Candidatus Eremiobacterota bacterium]
MNLLPIYSGPVTRVGPITFQEVADTLTHFVGNLSDEVHLGLPAWDRKSAEGMERVEELAASMTPDNSTEVKREMRTALWELRCALERGAGDSVRHLHPADRKSLREAIEKVRTIALDNSWEGQHRYPTQVQFIRPSVADVPNYRQLAPGLYAGGQPTQDGVQWLISNVGMQRAVDLRDEDHDNPYYQWIVPTWPGVQRIRIAVRDWDTPSLKQVEDFIQLADQARDHPTYVHCKAGIGRTGTMIACWRISQGWSVEKALE